jgi:hypothetical protein
MVAFSKRPKPLWQKIVKDPVFHVTTVLIVILVVVVLVRDQHKREMASRIQAIEIARNTQAIEERIGNSQRQSASIGDAKSTRSMADAQAEVARANANLLSAKVPAQDLNAAAAQSPSPTAAANPKTAASAPAKASRFIVAFAEIPDPYLVTLMGDTRSPASYGSVNTGIITGLEQKLNTDSASWAPLGSTAQQSFELNQPVIIFKGLHDPQTNQDIGVTLELTATAQDEAGTHFQLKAKYLLRDSTAPNGMDYEALTLPDQVVVPSGSSFIMTGILPHKVFDAADDRFYRNANVLRILTSEAFKADTSEFAILIQPK